MHLIIWTTLALNDTIYSTDSFVFAFSYCLNFKAMRYESTSLNRVVVDKSYCVTIALDNAICPVDSFAFKPGGGNAIYVPYGDVPPIRVYFLAFESETRCLFFSLTLKQGTKFVRSLRARVPIHSTVWHPINTYLLTYLPSHWF